ncbi:hypothetical protein EHQ12_02395 [Leptospira gomenensis]|uniref:Uncharacterized protein n=1 Tax=Leptospira gomenensis TaxID=2484974 RepID=A0A5F1YAW5_9LEPT|nr:hypothetical protein [Leptospira gomenensis]TGK33718.1 hypothetical protein EHQ17_10450 [Leptospira gomenensis]TGK41961.1 hypothetical protein EHQ07_15090 [Leptospira gomenensis]TGK44217.1 hypothetical protein EHQ12_02395 [Leptospira gomenensis]TGK58006.1 hypothetical protein EHQ13_14680 [Leptospira gomenensis]
MVPPSVLFVRSLILPFVHLLVRFSSYVRMSMQVRPPFGFRGAGRKAEGGAVEQWESGAVPEAVVNRSVF